MRPEAPLCSPTAVGITNFTVLITIAQISPNRIVVFSPAIDDPPLEPVLDAVTTFNRLTVSSPSFLCFLFIVLCTGMPYQQPLDATGHGAAIEPTLLRVPRLGTASIMFARL